MFSYSRSITFLKDNNALTKPKITSMDYEDLEEKLEHLLRFGKIIGVYPTGTLLDKVLRMTPYILASVAVVDLVGIALIKPEGIRTATELANDLGVPGFYCLGTFLYYYIQRNLNHLHQIFVKWKQLRILRPDLKLKRFVTLSSFCLLISAILENATFHFKLFPVFESPETYGNLSSLQVYYQRSHGHWALYVPYNPVVSILLCITNKLALYIWNFADILVAVISRALAFRISVILYPSVSREKLDNVAWDHVWTDYLRIAEMLSLIEKFLSPIIFACFTLNMYAICMQVLKINQVYDTRFKANQLHMWLTPSESKHYLHTLYLAWSFVHLLGRVLLVSINGAQVFEEMKDFYSKVQLCPEERYAEMERLEFSRKDNTQGLGLTGLGCFVLTKPFILSMFSVAFTFEVFLLQSDAIKVG